MEGVVRDRVKRGKGEMAKRENRGTGDSIFSGFPFPLFAHYVEALLIIVRAFFSRLIRRSYIHTGINMSDANVAPIPIAENPQKNDCV